MAIYKIRELQDILCEMAEDGYLYAEIAELDADDENPASLSFDAIAPYESVSYDCIDSYDLAPDDELSPVTFKSNDRCHEIGFTYEEIGTIHHAVRNVLEYFKVLEKDPQCPKDVKRDIKAHSVKCRNLQAKLFKFLNQIVPKEQ